jgi:hypothetical protein
MYLTFEMCIIHKYCTGKALGRHLKFYDRPTRGADDPDAPWSEVGTEEIRGTRGVASGQTGPGPPGTSLAGRDELGLVHRAP